MDLSRLLGSTLPVTDLLLSLALTTVLAFAWALVYHYRFPAEKGKRAMVTVLPIISLVMALMTLLLISSLAIALGLVGTLSIIRFRALTKSTLHLVALLVAIALGIAVAYGYFWPGLILIALLGLLVSPGSKEYWELKVSGKGVEYSSIAQMLKAQAPYLDLLAYEEEGGQSQSYYRVKFSDKQQVYSLSQSLREAFPEARVQIINRQES